LSDLLNLSDYLKRKDHQLMALIDNIPGVVYQAISHQGNRVAMRYLSLRIAEILGISVKEFMAIFEWIFDVIHPEDRMELYRVLEESKRHLSLLDHQYRLVDEISKAKWARILAQPHQLDNRDIIWNGVIIDISEQKNMEIAYELLLESMEIDYKQSEDLLQNLFPHEISPQLKKPIIQSPVAMIQFRFYLQILSALPKSVRISPPPKL
jgi:hypothetical protein